MIELQSVNKYFNRHKKNEIHVINNASVSFESKGLVALLGPSGCGKTTMLNTIGGLDKINSGRIYVDGEKLPKRCNHKVDKLRNLNIGYIFQDYKLVESMTVFDNVALSLKINGIKDSEEIKKRVLYTLEKVNMERYKNRPVSMLSGGERQRVGIARALVKNPKIILADEPTGNLDSKNSLEIMNIIKSISSKYLVILVTHEEELARFYADRIIELKDGVISADYENKHEGVLDYEIENQVYLKDYKEIEKIKKDNINVTVYRNNHEDLDIKIVYKNGNIYIETDNSDKVEIVDNNSNIELINDHHKEIKEAKITEDTFNIESVMSDKKPKYSSIFKLGSFISYGFKKILDYPILKKVLLGGFLLSGMFVFYSTSSIFSTIKIDNKDFIEVNKEYLNIEAPKYNIDDYLEFEKIENINYIIPSYSVVEFSFEYDKYLQTQGYFGTFNGSLSDINMINQDNLILGRMPTNSYEVVVDKMTIDVFIKGQKSKEAGFDDINDFLFHELKTKNMTFTIVGITDLEQPNIYAKKDLFLNIINDPVESYYMDFNEDAFTDYNLVLGKSIKLKSGQLPVNDYEVIVDISEEFIKPLNKTIDKKINGKKLKVVGYYEVIPGNSFTGYVVNSNMIKYSLIEKTTVLSIYSNDKDAVFEYFQNKNMKVYKSYDYAKKNYLDNIHDSMVNTLVVSGIILGISLLEILLMIRSSFLSRIKEVGIYRAIGVKKTDIYKMFSGEIFAITTVASIPGILFMAYILDAIKSIPYIGELYLVNTFTILFSIILVYVFNLVVGLIPVFNTIRKTPAEILSRFDVD